MQGPLAQTISFLNLDKFVPIITDDNNNNNNNVTSDDFSLYYSAILNLIKFNCRCLNQDAQGEIEDDGFFTLSFEGAATPKTNSSDGNDNDKATFAPSSIPVTCSFSLSTNHLIDEHEGTFSLGSVIVRASTDIGRMMFLQQDDDGDEENNNATSSLMIDGKFFNPLAKYQQEKLVATQEMLQHLSNFSSLGGSSSSSSPSLQFSFVLSSLVLSDVSGSTSIDLSEIKAEAKKSTKSSSAEPPSSSTALRRLELEHLQAVLSRLKLQYNTRTLKQDISLGNVEETIPTRFCKKCATSGKLDEALNPDFFEEGRKRRNQQQKNADETALENNNDDDEQKEDLKMKPWFTFSLRELETAQQSVSSGETNNRQDCRFVGCLACPNEYFCQDHSGINHSSNQHRGLHVPLPITQALEHSDFADREDFALLLKHTFNSPLVAAITERFEYSRNSPFLVTVAGDEETDSNGSPSVLKYQDVWREAWKMAKHMTFLEDDDVESSTVTDERSAAARRCQDLIVVSALRDCQERVVAEFAATFATVALLPLHVLSSSIESDDVATSKIVQNLIADVPKQLNLQNENAANVSTTKVVSVLVHPEHFEPVREKLKSFKSTTTTTTTLISYRLCKVETMIAEENDDDEVPSTGLSSPCISEAFQIARSIYERLRGPVETIPYGDQLLPASSAAANSPEDHVESKQHILETLRKKASKVKILEPPTEEEITKNNHHQNRQANNDDESDNDDDDDAGGLASFGVRRRKKKKTRVKRLSPEEQEAMRLEEERKRKEEEEIRARPPLLKNIDMDDEHDDHNKNHKNINNTDEDASSTSFTDTGLLFGLFPTSGSTSGVSTMSSVVDENDDGHDRTLSLTELAASHLPKLATYTRATWLRRLIANQPPEGTMGLFVSLQYAPMFHFSARSAVWDSLFFGGVRCLLVVEDDSKIKSTTSRNSKVAITINDRIFYLLPTVSPTGVFLVPSLWQRLREQWNFLKTSCHQDETEISQDLLGRRVLIVGSGTAACPHDLRTWIRDTVATKSCHNVRFKDSYGSTETGVTITSDGVVQSGVRVEIDENSLVWVKYENMFGGYFTDRSVEMKSKIEKIHQDVNGGANNISSSSNNDDASAPSLQRQQSTNEFTQEAMNMKRASSKVLLFRKPSSMTLGRDKGSVEETIAQKYEDPLDKCIQEQKRRNAIPKSVRLLEDGYHCTGDLGEWRRNLKKDASENASSSIGEESELDPAEYRTLALLGRGAPSNASSSSSSAKLSSGVFCRLDLIEGAAHSVRPRYIRETFAHVVHESFVILICYAPSIPSHADLEQLGRDVKKVLVGYANGKQVQLSSSSSSEGTSASTIPLIHLHHHEVPLIVKCINRVEKRKLPNDSSTTPLFTIQNGLLTASGKIKRNLASEFLSAEIDQAKVQVFEQLTSSSTSDDQQNDSLTQALLVSKIATKLGVDIRTVKATRNAISVSASKKKKTVDNHNDDDDEKDEHDEFDLDAQAKTKNDSDFTRLAEDLRVWHPSLLRNDKFVVPLDSAFVGANCLKPKFSIPSSTSEQQQKGDQHPFRILLTGATGHVGAAIVVSLLELQVANDHQHQQTRSSSSSSSPSKKKKTQSHQQHHASSSHERTHRSIQIFCLCRYHANNSSSSSSSSTTPAIALQHQKNRDRLKEAIEPYIPEKLKGHVRDAFEKYVKVISYSEDDVLKPKISQNSDSSTTTSRKSSTTHNHQQSTGHHQRLSLSGIEMASATGESEDLEFADSRPEEEILQEQEDSLNNVLIKSFSKQVDHFSSTVTPFDVVVHCAAHVDMVRGYKQLRFSNIILTKVMSSIFAARCRKFILLSTTSVNPLHRAIKHYTNFFSHKDDEEEAEREAAAEERRKIEQRIFEEAEAKRKEEEEKIMARMRKRKKRLASAAIGQNIESPSAAAARNTISISPTPPANANPNQPNSVRTAALAATVIGKITSATAETEREHQKEQEIEKQQQEEERRKRRENAIPRMPDTEAAMLAKELMSLAAGGSQNNESAGGAGVSNGGVGSYAITKAVCELVTLATFNEVRQRLAQEETKMVSAAAKAHVERSKLARKADSYDDIVRQMRKGGGGSGVNAAEEETAKKNKALTIEEQLKAASTLKELPTLAEVEIIRIPFIWCHTETGRSNLKDTFHRFAVSVLLSRCAFDPETIDDDLVRGNETRTTITTATSNSSSPTKSFSSGIDCFWNFLCADECASTILEKIFTPSRCVTPPPPPPTLDSAVMTSSPQFLQTFTPRKIPSLQSTIYRVRTSHQLFYRDFVGEVKRMSVTTTTSLSAEKKDDDGNEDSFFQKRASISRQLGFSLNVVDYFKWWEEMFTKDNQRLPVAPLVENFSRFDGPYFRRKLLVGGSSESKDEKEDDALAVEDEKRKICLDILNRNLSWLMEVVFELDIKKQNQ